jgi:type I restriction enzyme S subunit
LKRWLTKPLGELVSLEYGKALKAEERSPNGRFPVFGSNGIVGAFDRALVSKPTIVVGRKGAIGEAHLTENGCWPIDTAFYTVLRERNTVSLRFLLLWFRSVDFKSLAITSTIPGLNRNTLYSQLVPVPPLAEQERLVKLLDEADELRKLRAQADRRTADLIPSLFHKMLAEAEERNCPWPKSTLAGLCSRVVDCPHATPNYATSETPYACVRSSDIQDGKLDWASTKYVDKSEYAKRVKVHVPRPGDVVFCREGARLGNAALVTIEKEVCLGQRMMLFQVEPKVATPEFLCALLLSPAIQKVIWSLVGGSASPHLNVGDVKEFVTALPPLPLQKEFAARVSEIRALQAEQDTSRRRLEHLFQSMLHRAFQGEL